MNKLIQGAEEVCRFMSGRGWQFCIIGGLAVQHWGEPRTTLDADITLLTGWGEEEPYVAALLDHFESRLPDARDFALKHRVLLLRTSGGIDADIALGALPFEEDMVRNALPVAFSPGVVLPCCTAEDLFVMKAFASRPRDWTDAESVAARQENLDQKHIMEQLEVLCSLKAAPDILERARQILEARK